MHRKTCRRANCIGRSAQEYSIKHSVVNYTLGYLSECIQDIQISLMAPSNNRHIKSLMNQVLLDRVQERFINCKGI